MESTGVAEESCTFIFKKRNINNAQMRKRQKSSSDEYSSEEEASVKRCEPRKRRLNPNVHYSNRMQKRRKFADPGNDDDSSDDDGNVMVTYKSTRSAMAEGPTDQGATATLEIETERDRDAQAIFEKRLEINRSLEGQQDDKVYRGINNYAQFYKPRDTAAGNASSGMVRKGPIRAPANLRATVRWDYQPDVCKDYKETGFCGFGDSCKFLHDRSDYKHGWQLEKEWAEGKYGEESDDDKKYHVQSDDEGLPFKCVICRGSFTDPVVTKCKHYFCEKCALERYKKSTRCFACNNQTSGIFNPAMKLIARLNGDQKGKRGREESDIDSDSD